MRLANTRVGEPERIAVQELIRVVARVTTPNNRGLFGQMIG